MRLDEHAIDLFEIDDAGLIAHRFDQGTQAEIADPAGRKKRWEMGPFYPLFWCRDARLRRGQTLR